MGPNYYIILDHVDMSNPVILDKNKLDQHLFLYDINTYKLSRLANNNIFDLSFILKYLFTVYYFFFFISGLEII